METRWQSEKNVANNDAPPSTHENETLPCKHRLTSIIRERFSGLHATKRFQHRIKAQNTRFPPCPERNDCLKRFLRHCCLTWPLSIAGS
jgi:hypothetical protein